MSSTQLAPPSPAGGAPATLRSRSGSAERAGDRFFRRSTALAGTLVLVTIVAIGVFLVQRAIPALQDNSANFLTERQWFPDQDPPRFGVAALVWGTLISSIMALIISVPVALGVALYITEYAPPRVGRPLGYLIDLLAAVPSVVYGLWGVLFLVPRMNGLQTWLTEHLSFLPFFRNDSGIVGRSLFAGGVILAIMILPIIAAISREVFRQVPEDNREAALALGATKLEMIRTAVLPYSRPGVVSAIMLGLGRALGETIAVALVVSASFDISLQVLSGQGGNTIAANIANKFGEASTVGGPALVASGLVLFAITLVVNLGARAVVYRSTRLHTGAAG